MRTTLTVALLFFFGSFLGMERAGAEALRGKELIRDGDAESAGEGEGGLKADWSWSGVDADLKKDQTPGSSYQGKGAWHVVTRNGKTAQFCSQTFALRRNQAYRLNVVARGIGLTEMSVVVRQKGQPWSPYASEKMRVLPEWNPLSYTFIASSDEPDAVVVFIFEQADAQVWIDNLSLEEIQLPPGIPDRKENLLVNGGFEVLPSGSDWIVSRSRKGDLALDPVNPAEGRSSLRLEEYWPGPALKSAFASGPLQLKQNCPHVLTLSARAKDKQSKLTFALNAGKTVLFSQTEALDAEWKTFRISGSSLLGKNYYVTLQSSGGTVWVDGVSLHEGTTVPFKPPVAAETVGLSFEGVGRVFVEGKPVQVKLALTIPGDPARSKPTPLSWRLENWKGETFQQGVGMMPPGEKEATFDLIPELYGLHRLIVKSPASQEAAAIFMYLPPPQTLLAANSPWGNHYRLDDPEILRMAEQIGCGWGRAHWPPSWTQWKVVEPDRGNFRFEPKLGSVLKRPGVALLGMLDTTPVWAAPAEAGMLKKSGAYGTVFPESLESWRTYVRKTAEAFPEITTWEVFNEPMVPIFWKGSAMENLDLLRAACEELRKVNPRNRVIAWDWPNDLEKLKETGVLDMIQGFHVHLYGHGKSVDERVTEFRKELRELHAAFTRVGRPDLEIWNSEFSPNWSGSLRFPDNLEERQRAVEYMIKHTVSQRDLVSKFFPYLMDGGLSEDYAQLDLDGAPKAALAAYATVIRFWADGKPLGELRMRDPALRGYAVQRGEKQVLFVWSQVPSRSFLLTHTQGVSVFDEMGNPLKGPTRVGRMPVILRGNTSDLFAIGFFLDPMLSQPASTHEP